MFNYECLLFGKVLGTVSISGGLNSATAACNHRIKYCINDYEGSGNNDGNFGVAGGGVAQLQGKLGEKQKNNSSIVTELHLIGTEVLPPPSCMRLYFPYLKGG